MPSSNDVIFIAVALTLVVAPLLFGASGWISARRNSNATTAGPARWNWRLSVVSALLYTLAFNLTFFIQEFFLVLPKAFTPGLRVTLFHNNHAWEGDNPLAALFQGTGALATFCMAIACIALVRADVARSRMLRLWLIWMAYCGAFMALPQVVIGALSGASDVGMAMNYLGLGATAKTLCAVAALGAMPIFASCLRSLLLGLADDAREVQSERARSRFVFQIATLPALCAIVLIIPFRVPREFVEVALLPAVVTLIGIVWIQAGAWRAKPATLVHDSSKVLIAPVLAAVVLLLLIFQLVLRPGIRFY
jgi:hypothetical protein